jgi:LysM repeat protein
MTFRAGFLHRALCLLACVVVGGCIPSGSGPLDEEKEPHFLAGKSRISTLDYEGAIKCFEKALQVNPQSASAHFELAWLYDQKEMKPAAAIYHYDHYLELRPHAGNADLAKQRIMVCKQALAETVSLGPVTEKMQRQFEQVSEENKRLTELNKHLQEELEKWSAYAARMQTLTNQVGAQAAALPRASQATTTARTPVVAVLVQSSAVNAGGGASNSLATARTHTVKAGETPSLIAKKYGVKLEALLAANPNLDPRRLKVGQTLRIPGS